MRALNTHHHGACPARLSLSVWFAQGFESLAACNGANMPPGGAAHDGTTPKRRPGVCRTGMVGLVSSCGFWDTRAAAAASAAHSFRGWQGLFRAPLAGGETRQRGDAVQLQHIADALALLVDCLDADAQPLRDLTGAVAERQ